MSIFIAFFLLTGNIWHNFLKTWTSKKTLFLQSSEVQNPWKLGSIIINALIISNLISNIALKIYNIDGMTDSN